MRHLILLAALAAIPAHAEERWLHIADTNTGSYSIDTRTAKHSGNGATYWARVQHNEFNVYILQLTEVDCVGRRFRITEARTFVAGEYAPKWDRQAIKPWTPIAPETVIEGVADAICLENLE